MKTLVEALVERLERLYTEPSLDVVPELLVESCQEAFGDVGLLVALKHEDDLRVNGGSMDHEVSHQAVERAMDGKVDALESRDMHVELMEIEGGAKVSGLVAEEAKPRKGRKRQQATLARQAAAGLVLLARMAEALSAAPRAKQELKRYDMGRLRAIRQWMSTADALHELIVIVDLNFEIVRVNKAAAQIIGLTFNEILGRSLFDLFPDVPREAFQGTVYASDATIVVGDNLYRLSTFGDFDPHGNRIGTILVFTNVTQEVELKRRLAEADKLSVLAAVLGGAGHELNNPLSGVLGFSQLAAEATSEPKVRELLELVQKQASDVSRVISNLLSFARLNRGERRPLSIREVVDKAIALLAYEARLSRVSVDVRMASDLPAVWATEQEMEQALVSVLLYVFARMQRQNRTGNVMVSGEARPGQETA